MRAKDPEREWIGPSIYQVILWDPEAEAWAEAGVEAEAEAGAEAGTPGTSASP